MLNKILLSGAMDQARGRVFSEQHACVRGVVLFGRYWHAWSEWLQPERASLLSKASYVLCVNIFFISWLVISCCLGVVSQTVLRCTHWSQSVLWETQVSISDWATRRGREARSISARELETRALRHGPSKWISFQIITYPRQAALWHFYFRLLYN